jgi:hypothetical protein
MMAFKALDPLMATGVAFTRNLQPVLSSQQCLEEALTSNFGLKGMIASNSLPLIAYEVTGDKPSQDDISGPRRSTWTVTSLTPPKSCLVAAVNRPDIFWQYCASSANMNRKVTNDVLAASNSGQLFEFEDLVAGLYVDQMQ